MAIEKQQACFYVTHGAKYWRAKSNMIKIIGQKLFQNLFLKNKIKNKMFPMEETQTCLWPRLEVLKNDLLIVLNTWYKKQNKTE